jgi:hypothetical protein
MSLELVVVRAHDAADLLCAGRDDHLLQATRALAAVEFIRDRFPPKSREDDSGVR